MLTLGALADTGQIESIRSDEEIALWELALLSEIVISLPAKHLEFLGTRLNVSVRSRTIWNLEMLVF